MLTPSAARMLRAAMTTMAASRSIRKRGSRVRSREAASPPSSPCVPLGPASVWSRRSIAVRARSQSDPGQEHGDPDAEERAGDAAAEPPLGEGEQVEVPEVGQDEQADHDDDRVDRPAEHRLEGRGPGGEPRHRGRRLAPQQGRQDPAQGHVEDRHRHQDHDAQDAGAGDRRHPGEELGEVGDEDDHQVGRREQRPPVGDQPPREPGPASPRMRTPTSSRDPPDDVDAESDEDRASSTLNASTVGPGTPSVARRRRVALPKA